jgi:hypothetical protein
MSQFIKGAVLPYWISYSDAMAEQVYSIKELLPLFVGNIDDEPITLEQMKIYLNIHQPEISKNVANGIPTICFKLALNLDGDIFPALLCDWQVVGRPNKPDEVLYWSVFSPKKEAISILRWKIENYKSERLERLQRIALKEEESREEAELNAIVRKEEAEALELRRLNPKPLLPALWGNYFDEAV